MNWAYNMIRYRKQIELKENRHAQWILDSDRGDQYETQFIGKTPHPMTDWWSKQHQSELRAWQKDAVLGEFWRQHGELDLYLIYKRGQGYSQPHDMTLAYSPQCSLWLFSTEQHTWILPRTHSHTNFTVDLALGSVLDPQARQDIYQIIDSI
jgi:hypothetical protein